ncbi:MAG: helix-turn-helix domain-containing protein [Candidatus Faecivicinus sp.]
MSFSENLMFRRRQLGLSQEELGSRVGASRQAVSKWETGQTTPEMGKLIELARVFGCTLDELVNGAEPTAAEIRSEPAESPAAAECPPHAACGYEYRSLREWHGLPLVHINIGLRGRHRAKGVIAVGNEALGLVAVGAAACGLLSVGAVSCGLVALGALAAGLVSLGGVAAGVLALGGVAVGLWAAGGLAVGKVALGGLAVGSDVAVGGMAIGEIAIGDEAQGTRVFLTGELGQTWTAADAARCLAADHPLLARWIEWLL